VVFGGSIQVVNNFIGIFANAASKEYCERIIQRFEFVKEIQSEGRGKIWTREESEGSSKIYKDDSTYFMGGDDSDDLPFEEAGSAILGADSPLLKEFSETMWKCYDVYAKEYGILSTLMRHKMSPYVRVQKTEPSQGFHVWHCDSANFLTCRRMLVASLYLNTIEDGGETEFLYQRIRVSPIEGKLVLFPAGWTHPHRGNPPLKETKYILTTWLEYVDE